MDPIVISQSTDEPITLAQAAANLRIDADCGSPPIYFEAARIQALITASRIACENDLAMSLAAKTLQVSRDAWPCSHGAETRFRDGTVSTPMRSSIELPWGPVRSVLSVKYLNGDGADTTLDPSQYRTTVKKGVAILVPAYGVSWPAIRVDVDSVRVQYAAGYPSADSPPDTVPELIRQAMHLYIAHWFKNREAVDSNALAELPLGVKDMLWFYRKQVGMA